jgi:hypothetical protein
MTAVSGGAISGTVSVGGPKRFSSSRASWPSFLAASRRRAVIESIGTG